MNTRRTGFEISSRITAPGANEMTIFITTHKKCDDFDAFFCSRQSKLAPKAGFFTDYRDWPPMCLRLTQTHRRTPWP